MKLNDIKDSRLTSRLLVSMTDLPILFLVSDRERCCCRRRGRGRRFTPRDLHVLDNRRTMFERTISSSN